jgi:hypothetical protein
MARKRTRVAQSVGDFPKWVVQYFEPEVGRWFDIGDAKDTREQAETAHMRELAVMVSPDDDVLEYLADFDPQTMAEVPAGTPFCVTVLPTEEGPNGVGFIPSVVYENVSGFFPLTGQNGGRPWVWGPSLGEARASAEEYNTGLGVSPERAQEIVISSFRKASEQGKLRS